MNKFLLFTTGGGTSDPLNWDSSEAALYSVKDLESIKPSSARNIDLIFNTSNGKEVVSLKIKNGLHNKIISSIATAIGSGTSSIVAVADVDGGRYINSGICGVTIKSQENYIQTLTGNSRTQISCPRDNYSSVIIANIDDSDDVACTLELYDGSTYTELFNQINIPTKVSLKLEKDEISFDNSTYDLYATSGDSGGQLTFTFNY